VKQGSESGHFEPVETATPANVRLPQEYDDYHNTEAFQSYDKTPDNPRIEDPMKSYLVKPKENFQSGKTKNRKINFQKNSREQQESRRSNRRDSEETGPTGTHAQQNEGRDALSRRLLDGTIDGEDIFDASTGEVIESMQADDAFAGYKEGVHRSERVEFGSREKDLEKEREIKDYHQEEPVSDDNLTIRTLKGRVRGATVKAANGRFVDQWIGIPYAQKPLGR